MHDACLNLLDLLTPTLTEDTNRVEQVEAGPIPVQLPSFASPHPPPHRTNPIRNSSFITSSQLLFILQSNNVSLCVVIKYH
jgi:hypothetical protein